jgi:hypothetical protein
MSVLLLFCVFGCVLCVWLCICMCVCVVCLFVCLNDCLFLFVYYCLFICLFIGLYVFVLCCLQWRMSTACRGPVYISVYRHGYACPCCCSNVVKFVCVLHGIIFLIILFFCLISCMLLFLFLLFIVSLRSVGRLFAYYLYVC